MKGLLILKESVANGTSLLLRDMLFFWELKQVSLNLCLLLGHIFLDFKFQTSKFIICVASAQIFSCIHVNHVILSNRKYVANVV